MNFAEPWVLGEDWEDDRFAGCSIDNANGDPVATTSEGKFWNDHERVLARRIVACVNFCREFPTEFLEQNRLRRYQEASFKGVGYAGLIPFDTKNCADCQDPAKEPE